jgi:hypothetical protein
LEISMPRYAITEKAGRFVAAHRNTGVGMVLELTERQAEHELRLGSLVALDTSLVPLDLDSAAATGPSPAVSEGEPLLPVGAGPPRKLRRSKQ